MVQRYQRLRGFTEDLNERIKAWWMKWVIALKILCDCGITIKLEGRVI